jgi:hypothetical protein
MIRTVPIPTTVSRMGCTACAGAQTGPPVGPARTHVHAIPSARNSALRSHLGDVTLDPNDMTGGIAPDCAFGGTWPDCITPSTTPGTSMFPTSTKGGMSPTTMYLLGGLLLVGLLEITRRR